MATVSISKNTADPKNTPDGLLHIDLSSMKTNSVDRVSSLLTSLVFLVGLSVMILALLFFLSLKADPPPKLIMIPEERIAGRGDHSAGFDRDFDPPGADEVEALAEPAMEQTLQMVTDAVSSIAATMEAMESAMAANSNGTGKGDSRPPGPLGEGDDIVPRFERWELKFSARDRRSYALQLDFFKIELAAIGGGMKQVDYASNVASNPMKRSGPGDTEKRLYFMYRAEGALLQYDRQLLQAAGVQNNGRVVLKFIPKETEDLLVQAEALYYRDKRKTDDFRVTNIAKTIFECRPASKGQGFEWVVIDQRYRNPSGK